MEHARSPVFIVGCPRSGTTLLRNLLRSHPELAIPEESHVVRGNTTEENEDFGKLAGAELRAALESHGRYAEHLEDAEDHSTFVPQIGSGTGGSSSLYGMTLERFFPSDFEPRAQTV